MTMRGGRILSALVALAASALAVSGAYASEAMATIPAGLYHPFQRVKAPTASGDAVAPPQPIASFRLDVEPVTNGEFLAFVAAHPEWRRSKVKRVFADERYLRRWSGDLELGQGDPLDAPATNVSWFAAEAYCKARGLKLPTTEQWEYALAGTAPDREAVRTRSFTWMAQPNDARPAPVGQGLANSFGVRDMVGLVWEWTYDFDAYATTAESRDPNGKDSAAFCGGAAAGVADPSDYPAFMRYAMRASLKADYTADNLGFRCAGGA